MRQESSPATANQVNVRPVAPYVGGKRGLAAAIIARIAKIPHHTYAEPFIGMGGVFLRRPTAAKAEYINDYSRDVATFFRVLQRHYTAFLDMLRFQLTTRVEFERLMATDPSTLTDLERAARFLYLQRTSFGGKVASRNFGTSPGNPARFDVSKVVPALEDLHIRLTAVTIECLPYGEFIDRYDQPGTLFYLDPPYWGSEGYYGKDMFGKADFERLADQLAGIKGRFLLSINDVPQIRRIFGRFKQQAVSTTYTVRQTGPGKKAKELIISNG
ncbi:DNA adenine methylase [Dongia sp.]|uniref:DNA adenine methylase n=1 Tax=Dongia sp. TaxID=1977262 RepID=UPI0035B17F9B